MASALVCASANSHARQTRPDIIDTATAAGNFSTLLAAVEAADLVDTLKDSDEGRIVICDLPPYLATDDALAFEPLADAFLVVVCEGKTSRDALTKGLDILAEMPLLGMVLNRSEGASTGYYYY